MTIQQQWSHSPHLPRLEAQMLLLHALGRDAHDRAWLLAHGNQTLTTEQQACFARLVERRLAGEPVAYLTGYKEFFGLRLQVNAHVLDPRPDTETLVDWALERLQARKAHETHQAHETHPPPTTARVLDLGTGSGAVGLAIKHTHPQSHVFLLDASQEALDVAGNNAAALGLDVTLLHGHWLKNIHQSAHGEHLAHGAHGAHSQGAKHSAPAQELEALAPFDLIVSNPPYIAQEDAHLAALKHEPQMALTSGVDGLDAIREIIADAPKHLAAGGWLLLEHGYDQASAVRNLLQTHGFRRVESRKDSQGIERCSGGAR